MAIHIQRREFITLLGGAAAWSLAKALGIDVPPSLLTCADEVIE